MAPSPASGPGAPRAQRLAVIGLGLLIGLLYANALSGGFIFDASVLILEDSRVSAFSLNHLADIAQHTYWWPYAETALYRPATTLSYLFNYSVFGNADRSAGYHAFNIVLHAINSALLFALMLKLLRRFWPAALGAALWAAHPLATEAVTNIVGRADLLAACGVLGALNAHVLARSTVGGRRVAWLAAVALLSALAALSKESGVTVVGVIVLYDVLTTRPFRWVDVLPSWAASAVPVLLFLVQRSRVIGAAAAISVPFVDNPIAYAGFWQGRLTALAVAGRYLWLAIWPATLSADYSHPQIPLASGTTFEWIAWIVVAVLVGSSFLLYRSQRALFLLMLCAALTFLPVSNLLFTTGTIMGERLAYLPLAFIAGVVATGAFALQFRTGVQGLAPALLGVLIAALGARTIVRNADWQSELSLWTAAVAAAPHSFKSHSALAEALYNADPSRANLGRVIAEKEISLSLLAGIPHPEDTSRPYREAAAYYLERGNLLTRAPESTAAAAAAYQRAVALLTRYLALLDLTAGRESDRTMAQLMLATAQERLQNDDAAVEAARSAAHRDPFNPMTYRLSASALLGAQRADEAAATLMTGFMVTGQAELRSALVDLYKAGLDQQGCAIKQGASGIVLNVDCDIVHRHLCQAAAEASAIQRQAGHPDLAALAEQSTGGRCESVGRLP